MLIEFANVLLCLECDCRNRIIKKDNFINHISIDEQKNNVFINDEQFKCLACGSTSIKLLKGKQND
ncbi:hypothetical protein [Aliarcobacter cryaerophilus]|uniref:Uncharacterized protein n=1 Tax=Aliarcobacter cryaerophilus TaxID=28198 RepID=A0AA46N069_9BACT|nr:hypothetical protein [Aliarcobacter cryaerophilus]UYF42541.1 hypothetical protein NGX11_06415 [Aliarcobacter cryaerophilus]